MPGEPSLADGEGATASYEEERREFSKQIADKEERVQQLEAQLGERSNLVLGLEQEKLDVQETLRALELETEQSSSALAKAERHAEEYADHIGQLDDKLHRQQELMLNLEEELAQAQQAVLTNEKEKTKALSEKDQRIVVLTEEIETHNHGETLVEEQFEELKKSQESALAESEALISAGREEIKNMEKRLAEREAQLEKQQASLQSVSEDTDRFENALAQAIAAAEEMEKDRDDFAGQVDLLESELRDQKRETAKVEQTLKAANKLSGKRKSAEVDTEQADSLQLEVQKLEQMVRDRTEQLNRAQWRQHMAVKDAESSPVDSKTMLVLNQQLADARASNEQLLEQLRELKGGRRNKSSIESDDLTKIHGVGAKLAKQLNSLGIFRYEQIAGLDEPALSSESHVLYLHKGRILRDDWIQQAAKLAR